MRIRAAEPDDVVGLVPLFEDWGHRQTEEQISAVLSLWCSTPLSEILLADDHKRIAGMAAISASPRLADLGRNASLAGLVVASDYRRKNVGSQLLSAAEALARSWGCTRLELTSSRSRRAAHKFYPGHGYEETSERQARYVRPLDADPLEDR